MGLLRCMLVAAIGYFVIQFIEKSSQTDDGPLSSEWAKFAQEYQSYIVVASIALFEFIF